MGLTVRRRPGESYTLVVVEQVLPNHQDLPHWPTEVRSETLFLAFLTGVKDWER
jgi:hypothetical protein